MGLTSRKPISVKREEPKKLRDARLIVIASEDRYAPAQYFAIFHSTRLKIKVLPTEDCQSSPQHVMARLERFCDDLRGDYDDGDCFWLVLDTDRWVRENHTPNLTAVIQQARKRKFQTAISNPSFEIWLLLHLLDLAKVLPDEAQRAARFPHSDAVETELRRLLGTYNKRAVNPGDFINRVEEAMKHADKLPHPVNGWPQSPGTQVLYLVDQIRAML